MNDFVYGFGFPFRSFGLFFRFPKLILYSIVPMVINLIIYGTIFFFVYQWFSGFAGDSVLFQQKDNFFFDTLRFLLKAAVFLLILLICYFLFIIFGGLVSAPFNESISKHVEEKMFTHVSNEGLPFFRDAVMSIREEAKKLLFYFSVIIPLFAVNFIPMIGSVVSFSVGTPFSFYYNALDFMDYPMTRQRASFRNKLRTVSSRFSLSLGFGFISFLMTFLPVINVIMKPLLVVSGTVLYYERQYDLALQNLSTKTKIT